MTIITIEAGKEKQFPVTKRYLNVLSLSAKTVIRSVDDEWQQTLKQGWTLDLQKVSLIVIKNDNAETLTVELESAPFPIVGGGAEGVEITNNPTIQKIIEPIAVTASATVENGTVFNLLPNRQTIMSVEIAPNTCAYLKPYNDSLCRRITVQIISDEITECAVGAANISTENKGLLLIGSRDAPASYAVLGANHLYIRNNSDTVARAQILEQWRTSE